MGFKFRMGSLILDDVDLFVVKGIKYQAVSGNHFGKTNYVIESVGSRADWISWIEDRRRGFLFCANRKLKFFKC